MKVVFILEFDGVEGRIPLITKETQTYWRNSCQSKDEEEKRNHNGGHLQLIPECDRTGSQNIKGSSTKRWRSVRSVSVVPRGSVKQVLLSLCYICLCYMPHATPTGWEGRYLSAVSCQSSKVWNLRGYFSARNNEGNLQG